MHVCFDSLLFVVGFLLTFSMYCFEVDDKEERKQDMTEAEMIPTKPSGLGFWQKFAELQVCFTNTLNTCMESDNL